MIILTQRTPKYKYATERLVAKYVRELRSIERDLYKLAEDVEKTTARVMALQYFENVDKRKQQVVQKQM